MFLFLWHIPTMPDASNPRAHIVSLPSLSSQLSSLPQAKSMANLPLYTSPLSAQHAAHSEAKVRFFHSDHSRLRHKTVLRLVRPASQGASAYIQQLGNILRHASRGQCFFCF